MRKIALNKVLPGARLAKTVLSLDGGVLLSLGAELKETHICRLLQSGIGEVYIGEEFSAGVELKETLCEQMRIYAKQQLKSIVENWKGNVARDIDELNKVIDTVAEEISINKELIVSLFDIRALDDYTFEHSISVCLLSIIIGMGLGYSKYRLKELGMGAVLHDIGKLGIPGQLLKKPSRLTEDEFSQVRKHTVHGYEILKKIKGISSVSMCVALMHHERMDGSGYPLGMKGEEIHEYARIAAIADVYDALTSDRVYRRKLRPHKVVEYLSSTAASHFDRKIIDVFLNDGAGG